MTTGTLDRPGILDRPDTIYRPITGDFARAIIGYSLCFKCEWVHGCDNEVQWYGDLHGCEQAHICDVHMVRAERVFAMEMQECGFIRCRHCRKLFNNWGDWIKVRPI